LTGVETLLQSNCKGLPNRRDCPQQFHMGKQVSRGPKQPSVMQSWEKPQGIRGVMLMGGQNWRHRRATSWLWSQAKGDSISFIFCSFPVQPRASHARDVLPSHQFSATPQAGGGYMQGGLGEGVRGWEKCDTGRCRFRQAWQISAQMPSRCKITMENMKPSLFSPPLM